VSVAASGAVTAAYRPQRGDVLVSRSSARADHYRIGIVDDAEHSVAQRFDEAVRMAKRLARQQEVDGWYTVDHTHFLLVAHHRSGVDATPMVARHEVATEDRGDVATGCVGWCRSI
jgi:hypothetical protein